MLRPTSPSRLRGVSHEPPNRPDARSTGVAAGILAIVLLLALVYVGSEGLRWFDAALAPYLFGTLLAVFATAPTAWFHP